MIADIASKAAQKSNVPFQVDALGTLEDALEGILEKVFVAAYQKAKERGSSEIDASDIQAVHKQIMSRQIKHSKKTINQEEARCIAQYPMAEQI